MTDTEFYIAGETFARTLTFTDEANAVFDPATITSVIKDPAGTTLTTYAITDLTRVSTGIYKLSYLLSSSATVGQYSLTVTSTDSVFTQKETFYFTVVSGAAGYSSIEDVKSLITTDLPDDKVIQIIADADIDLDDRLEDATMTSTIKRLCSMRLAAVTIAQKMRSEIKLLDGETSTLGNCIKEWNLYVTEKVSYAKHVVPRQYGERWIVSDATAET